MKKPSQLKGLINGLVLGIGLTATTSVFASDAINAVFNNKIKYIVDGESVSVSSPAIFANNSIYLKARDMAGLFDANVKWDSKTSTVSFDRTAVPSKSTTTGTVGEKSANKEEKAAYNYNTELSAPFANLPITKTIGDFSITINSISKDKEGNKILSLTTKNNSGKPTKIITSGNAFINIDIDGLKATPVGFNSSGIKGLGDNIPEVEKNHEFNLGKDYANGAKNIRLSLGFDGFTKFSYKENVFIFNINTDGLL